LVFSSSFFYSSLSFSSSSSLFYQITSPPPPPPPPLFIEYFFTELHQLLRLWSIESDISEYAEQGLPTHAQYTVWKHVRCRFESLTAVMTEQKAAMQQLTLLLCVLQVPGSNLQQGTDHPIWRLNTFLSTFRQVLGWFRKITDGHFFLICFPKPLALQIEERRGEERRGDRFCFRGGVRNCISSFEGSQAVPARPSGRGTVYGRNLFLYDIGRAAL
jgi:hypothetical protein